MLRDPGNKLKTNYGSERQHLLMGLKLDVDSYAACLFDIQSQILLLMNWMNRNRFPVA